VGQESFFLRAMRGQYFRTTMMGRDALTLSSTVSLGVFFLAPRNLFPRHGSIGKGERK
jgi:hypothetical protein